MEDTATHHLLDFNLLSPEDFANCCHWLVYNTGEYPHVEFYDSTSDKKRDVIGYTEDEEPDYFQCKRYKDTVTYGELKTELDELKGHIENDELKKPRQIYFVLSIGTGAETKDKIKSYAVSIGLPEPRFWERKTLDMKVRRDKDALLKFFNMGDKREEKIPQVDVSGQIAYGTHDYKFIVANNGDTTAIDCRLYLMGFGQKYKMPQGSFNLKPQETKEVRMGMPGDFLKLDPWKELKIRFEYRNNQGIWYYSDRLLNIEKVRSGAFYIISAEAGSYTPAQVLPEYSIVAITQCEETGFLPCRIIVYTTSNQQRTLKIKINYALVQIWGFDANWLNIAFKEFADKKITEMIKTGKFQEELSIDGKLLTVPKRGFEAYQEVRDRILK